MSLPVASEFDEAEVKLEQGLTTMSVVIGARDQT